MSEHNRRPWRNDEIERRNFEDIVKDVFQEYKDNMMISQSIIDEILCKISKEIRKQLKDV